MNTLSLFFYSLRWQDAADILVASYVLFRLYALFRDTPVIRVLIALAVLWFFQIISAELGLVVTTWAIRGITAASALIIIVVFRNEIRSVLQAENLKSILWGSHRKSPTSRVETIADAIFTMGKQRIGALIVFPRREDITETVQQGIPWQGVITREMLISIFWHDNPVHDGAAVIEGDRVTQVGAILPLSQRKDIASHYGTRHRAALGMSETTDALVVVVSEERGMVTTAQHGNLASVPDRATLIQLLREHFGIIPNQRMSFRRGPLRLATAAVVCFLFVTALWFNLTRGADTLVSYEVPVEFRNRQPEMEMLNTPLQRVQVQLSGSEGLIQTVRPEHLKVRIDLGDAEVGNNTIVLRPENVPLPPGVRLNRIDPPALEIRMDVLVERQLPVQVHWVGQMAETLVLESARLEPSRILVSGGSLAIDTISTIYTEPVPLDALLKSGTLTVRPVIPSEKIMVAPGISRQIHVRYVVKERTSGDLSKLK